MADADVLLVRGVLSGLNASTRGGWHIHAGFSCASHAEVGGHFYPAGAPDVWKPTTYTADADGIARLAAVVPATMGSVLGRTLVVHNSYGSRVGCGVIMPRFGDQIVEMGAYPECAGALPLRNLLRIACACVPCDLVPRACACVTYDLLPCVHAHV